MIHMRQIIAAALILWGNICWADTNLFKPGQDDPVLRKLAESGDAVAMDQMADRLMDYNHSPGKDPSLAEAAKWYRKAAELGHAGAQAKCAVIAITGYHGVIDEAEALGWARKSADAGDVNGQFILAQFYRAGIGTPRSPVDESFAILDPIAKSGHVKAMSSIAQDLVHGTATRRNLPRAVALHSRAEDSGGQSSVFWLASTLAEQQSAPPTDLLARYYWATQRVSTNHPIALHIMGLAFSESEMAPVDNVRALAWFLKAAEAGHLPAWERLGYFYEKGLGVVADRSRAIESYRKAAAISATAKEALDRLTKQSGEVQGKRE